MLGGQDHTLTVTEVEPLTSHVTRIGFLSPSLFDDLPEGPATYIRCWFPDPARPGVEHQRGFTPILTRRTIGAFSIDFLLHEPAGPASNWARHAAAGQRLGATVYGTTPFELPDPPPTGMLLIGDPASLPALNSIIDALPDEVPIELYLEQSHPLDVSLPVATHPQLQHRWVSRTSATSLADAIEIRDWRGWHVWALTEASSLKRLRPVLKSAIGFPKTHTTVQAYWTQGRSMGRSRGDSS